MSEELDKLCSSLKELGWDDRSIQLGVKFDFKCFYCEKDLLASVVNFKSWERDHVVPFYVGGEDSVLNIVLSCRICNTHAKNRWDPHRYLESGQQPTQENLRKAAKRYIEEKTETFEKDLKKINELVNCYRNS